MISSLQEAQKFVDQFIKKEYTPEEHAAFLQWLQGATIGELTSVSGVYESRESEWALPEGPSAAWVMQLERKLNELGENIEEKERGRDDRGMAPVILMRPAKRLRWNIGISAAAVVVLVTGTYLYVKQSGAKLRERADREKLLSLTFVDPRGGAQKEMTLADGSKVWLEAGSELKYPPRFTGTERLVELSGEAFFDVTKDAGRPFRVLIRDAEVEVLGTFFSIMAYDDEPENRTAVVSGAVKVKNSNGSVTVRPGEEAKVIYASHAGVADAPVLDSFDTNRVLLRKMGIYSFQSTELSLVLREVARAYNVNVQYQPNVGNPRIDGSLDLNKSLEKTLSLLDDFTRANQIKFIHSGKTIIASPT